MRRLLPALLVALVAPVVLAPARAQAPPASTARPAAAGPPPAAAQDERAQDAVELPTVEVIGHRPDPFGFRNPVEAETTVFERAWNEPPSIEEIGMRGGIVQMGINKGLELAAKAVRRLPGWQNQIVDARARPPPLDEGQLARAARLRESAADEAAPD